MANKIKYNLKNVHYAIQSGAGTTKSYGTPVAIKGAVAISLAPQGDEYKFYADGIEYYKNNTNNGYSGDLEVALIPEAFRTDVLGELKDTAGNIVERADAEAVKFALGFQVDGDESETLYWFYGGTATRPTAAGTTKNESIEAQTDTLTLTFTPDEDGYVRVKSGDTTSTSSKAAWFNAVVTPAVATL